MARIEEEGSWIPADTVWKITLEGGESDGDVLEGRGFPHVAPRGLTVNEVERFDAELLDRFREPVKVEYELVPGSEDFVHHTARMRLRNG